MDDTYSRAQSAAGRDKVSRNLNRGIFWEPAVGSFHIHVICGGLDWEKDNPRMQGPHLVCSSFFGCISKTYFLQYPNVKF